MHDEGAAGNRFSRGAEFENNAKSYFPLEHVTVARAAFQILLMRRTIRTLTFLTSPR
jgi:hypothetical protein